jgi:hypothetical protein
MYAFRQHGALLVVTNFPVLVEPHSYYVTVEWLTLLLCIREVTTSNLSPETDYPD